MSSPVQCVECPSLIEIKYVTVPSISQTLLKIKTLQTQTTWASVIVRIKRNVSRHLCAAL